MPDWIQEVNWPASEVEVDLTREQIKGSPAFEAEAPLRRDYETKYYDHYHRSAYWH